MAAKTISVRLDPADVSRLAVEAGKLGVSPGTFARVLIKAGLDAPQKPGTYTRAAKLRARDKRLRAGWAKGAPVIDSVIVAREARDELDSRFDILPLPFPSDPNQ